MRQKLTEEEVRIIKTLLNNGIMTQKKIGEMFGVSRETITKIKNRTRWADIEPGDKVIKKLYRIEYEL